MKITDIIALAKAGYKASEIKELLSMDREPDGSEGPAETAAREPAQPEPENDPTPAQADEPVQADESASKIKELEDQLAQVRADLAAAQKRNTSADISSKAQVQNSQEVLNDIARSFM